MVGNPSITAWGEIMGGIIYFHFHNDKCSAEKQLTISYANKNKIHPFQVGVGSARRVVYLTHTVRMIMHD